MYLSDASYPTQFQQLLNNRSPMFLNVEFLGDGRTLFHITVNLPVTRPFQNGMMPWQGCNVEMIRAPGTDELAAEVRITLVDYLTAHPDAHAAFAFPLKESERFQNLAHWIDIFRGRVPIIQSPVFMSFEEDLMCLDTNEGAGDLSLCRFVRYEGVPHGTRDF
jgi:hypothetical protein